MAKPYRRVGTLTDPGVDDPQATNPAGWFARTYAYSASIPHAVTSVNPETGSPDTYSYDANGNMICRIENGVTYTHAYNAENRASSIAKRTPASGGAGSDCATGTIIESWSFAYDGDGTRVTTAHFTGTQGTPDSVTSYFMGGQYEVKDPSAGSGQAPATKKYYSIAGMMVAVNDGTGLQYLLTDHLGSTVAVTNASGTLTSQQRYLPFGEAQAASQHQRKHRAVAHLTDRRKELPQILFVDRSWKSLRLFQVMPPRNHRTGELPAVVDQIGIQ